ncbi:hypothetical protein [Halosimplex pelagicum]|uniref:Uncharacterized protein n=1 Tax=Halosimplex pelagicum TaxID=869886 RepID=A0A7D5PAG9_9EURY|nr:hypothetical protein [Halosimplex pelagicum]QLH84763.1 hypothetical protein HZS54_25325 [Halosimplex pelagicum]
MAIDDDRPGDDLTDREVEALHEVELGVEWLRRAHGKLVAFHHNTGHAMEHLESAEALLRESGHTDLADEIRDSHLPRGVVDEDRWSYDVLASFEHEFMADVSGLADRARRDLADGRHHVAERRQEREWKRDADPE